jgi:hypothetical protein
MTFWQWLEFIQYKVLPWAPVAALFAVIAYEAIFVCRPFANQCRYPARNPMLGEPYKSTHVDYSRGCAFGVRGVPNC